MALSTICDRLLSLKCIIVMCMRSRVCACALMCVYMLCLQPSSSSSPALSPTLVPAPTVQLQRRHLDRRWRADKTAQDGWAIVKHYSSSIGMLIVWPCNACCKRRDELCSFTLFTFPPFAFSFCLPSSFQPPYSSII